MPSRRDQLHSYQFLLQRVISALVMRETDPLQAPLRRGVGAVFAGVMIAIIVAAGYGVYGIFTGIGGVKWKTDGAVVIEKGNGATYVYKGGTLYPTVNYASALLASGSGKPQVFRVDSEKLLGVHREGLVGIPGAPNSLPDQKHVIHGSWTLCSIPPQNKDISTVGKTITTTLLVGRSPVGGTPLADSGLLIGDPRDGSVYLVWHNARYPITSPNTVLSPLFGNQISITYVGTAWLNGLPAGAAIGPINVPNRGGKSRAVPNRTIGDLVFDRTGAGQQYYLVLDDGLAPLTEVQRLILAAQYSTTPQEITVQEATADTKSSALAPSDQEAQPPANPPHPVDAQTVMGKELCAQSSSASSPPQVSVGGDISGSGPGIVTTGQTSGGTSLADRIVVPAGRAVVVLAMPSPNAQVGALNIVTDMGRRFPVASETALAALGYGGITPVRMPSSLVLRIPAGPTLDPAMALNPVAPAGK